MARVIIVGGGAAGLSAAISAAWCGDSVCLLERMDRVGKKLLATGNGRCNLMNLSAPVYPGSARFAQAVLDHCGVAEQTAFWHALGLHLRQEEGGRVYPVSGQASTVLDVLRLAMSRLGVTVETNAAVDGLRRTPRGWEVQAGERRYLADRVIVAGGGCAQPKLGSNGSVWPLLTALGHRLIPPRPALTQLVTDTAPIRGLSGIRVRAEVWLTCGAQTQHREKGELLFADYGVTGVCAMQCARFAREGSVFHIRLTEGLGFADDKSLLESMKARASAWSDRPVAELLTGLCVPRLAQALERAAWPGQAADRPCASLRDADLSALARALGDFPLRVKGVKGFENAQVTAGGLDTAHFEARTLASSLVPGLHVAGEALDVDGDCGGFNLMFAFGSGILAGLNGRLAPWADN